MIYHALRFMSRTTEITALVLLVICPLCPACGSRSAWARYAVEDLTRHTGPVGRVVSTRVTSRLRVQRADPTRWRIRLLREKVCATRVRGKARVLYRQQCGQTEPCYWWGPVRPGKTYRYDYIDDLPCGRTPLARRTVRFAIPFTNFRGSYIEESPSNAQYQRRLRTNAQGEVVLDVAPILLRSPRDNPLAEIYWRLGKKWRSLLLPRAAQRQAGCLLALRSASHTLGPGKAQISHSMGGNRRRCAVRERLTCREGLAVKLRVAGAPLARALVAGVPTDAKTSPQLQRGETVALSCRQGATLILLLVTRPTPSATLKILIDAQRVRAP